MRRAALIAVVVVVGLGLASLALWSGPRTRDAVERPNLVMVVACTLRRDQLTPYGGLPHASPFLQEVAERGVRFSSAVDAAPWTKAASTALMTGHHPVQVGMIEPDGGPNRRRLSAEVITLAEHLSAAGYETIGLTANPNTNALFGFDQGFDHYDEVSRLWGRSRIRKPPMALLADRVLEQIDRRSDPEAPLYARMMVIDTHEPLFVRKRDARQFRDDGAPMRVAAYRAMVRQLDDGIRHLWEGLNARGLTGDNTVLVVVNDHGEGLSWPPEHGKGHGNHLQLSAVGMPWLMMGAGVAPGQVIDGMASQVDVLPTLLGLAGVSSGYAGPGQDFSALVRGQGTRTDRTEAFSDTWFRRASRAAIYTEHAACLHDFSTLAEELGRERVNPRTACYDLDADPSQRQAGPIEPALMNQLQLWRAERMREFTGWAHHEDIRVPDDVAAQLEALGYAQGEPVDTGTPPEE
jgi:arylsulfatase A-like enzyme